METVIMGLIRKAARARGKAAEAEAGLAEAEAGLAEAEAGLAEAEAGLAEAEAKVAQEQAAAIARALHEDEVHRHADLEEVAEEEAEAVPWSRQAAADAGMPAAPDRKEHSSLRPLISGPDGPPPVPRQPLKLVPYLQPQPGDPRGSAQTTSMGHRCCQGDVNGTSMSFPGGPLRADRRRDRPLTARHGQYRHGRTARSAPRDGRP
jgi:hypothetical protein